jgi:outer membrane protein assembly factor BamD
MFHWIKDMLKIKKIKKCVSFVSIVLAMLCVFASCHTPSVSEIPAEEGMARIRQEHQAEEWSLVIADVSEYKVRYPYSKYVVEAELLQADAYFQSKKYAEAIVSYDDFIRKNPSHTEVPLAQYRIAKSYDAQAPNDEDRDQSNTERAFDKYKTYVEKYPTAPNVDDAKKRMDILERRLADNVAFIANFYWEKDEYAAALMRYLFITSVYSKFHDLNTIARARLVVCYEKLADMLEKDPTSDKYVFF